MASRREDLCWRAVGLSASVSASVDGLLDAAVAGSSPNGHMEVKFVQDS